jgi:cobalamin biosynthesis Co2+ chelatase CbiK
MIAIVEPPLAAILAALWLASSIGCGFIPQSNKFGEEYKNLTQEAIDEAKQTVTFESLPKHDQDLVDDLLKSSDENSIIEKIRNLRDSKKFEKPIQTLALIQKEHASWQPKIVPAG